MHGGTLIGEQWVSQLLHLKPLATVRSDWAGPAFGTIFKLSSASFDVVAFIQQGLLFGFTLF